jgi:hypothetical protein
MAPLTLGPEFDGGPAATFPSTSSSGFLLWTEVSVRHCLCEPRVKNAPRPYLRRVVVFFDPVQQKSRFVILDHSARARELPLD